MQCFPQFILSLISSVFLVLFTLLGTAAAQETISGQVTSVSQLTDGQPTDWEFGALRSLGERYDRHRYSENCSVAESVYETVSESLAALSPIRRNHSVIQQRQNCFC